MLIFVEGITYQAGQIFFLADGFIDPKGGPEAFPAAELSTLMDAVGEKPTLHVMWKHDYDSLVGTLDSWMPDREKGQIKFTMRLLVSPQIHPVKDLHWLDIFKTAFNTLKGIPCGIGFKVVRSETIDGIRMIKEMEILELSLVL